MMNDQNLQEIYGQNAELQKQYSKTMVCFDYPQSVLVPLSQYKTDDARILLHTMFGIGEKDTIVTDEAANWQLNNIYAVPDDVHKWTFEHFGNIHHSHTYSIGLRQVEVTDFEGSIVLDFRSDDFSMIVTRANKLMLAQTYTYSTPADVVYYLLNTCRQFGFSQESVRITISGLVDQQSVLYREIYNYFLHIRFREPQWLLPAGEENYPLHFFTSLNDLARCAS